MKFNYKFSNLLGTVYKSGNILFTKDGNVLICPVGNKISMYDLANNRSSTLPIEARFNYTSLALSPNGNILIAAQEDGELHIINLGFKAIIYRKRINGNIKNIKFSPNGKHFAISKNRTVFVYNSPSCSKKIYDPFSLEKVFERAYDDILCIDWSHDSRLICFGSQDMSTHVCGFERFENLHDCLVSGTTDSIIGAFFEANSYDLCTVSQNGLVNTWSCSANVNDLIPVVKQIKKEKLSTEEEEDDIGESSQKDAETNDVKKKQTVYYKRKHKMYLNDHLKGFSNVVTSTCYRKESKILVCGFTTGDFLLIDTSETLSLLHSLNISQKAITSTCFNSSGDWIALGVSAAGELVVWEYQSETHVLKQQGHFNTMRVVTYSPDGLNLATGGEDGKVKIWSTQTSFCFVTFSEHTSAVTGVTFTQSGKAILSSSLDGTIRAFDMIRYRNFKTLTTPKPTQFSCLAVDSSGELVVAGGQDVHDIFLWSLQTGSLLEILGGHTGPVVSLQFSSTLGSTTLISTAWDKSVKVWDAIDKTTAKDTVVLLSEGMCVAFRHDGKQFAVSTMNGHITMFDTSTLRQEKCIEGQHDLGAGREDSDKTTAKTNIKTKYFTSLSYSSDGKYIIAAGQSKNVCIYSIDDELLVKKFTVTQNRSLGAMDETLSRRKMAENGINLSLIEMREKENRIKAPGSRSGTLSERTYKPEVRVTSLTFSRTGRSWAACTTEGLLIYSLDDDWLFDPLQLEEDNTPEAVKKKLKLKKYSLALMMACRLNIKSLTIEVLESVPLKSISLVVDSLSQIYIESLLKILPSALETSRHVGFYSMWVSTIVTRHGSLLKERAPGLTSELSALQKSLTTHSANLSKVCCHNEYMLSYILCQAVLKRKIKPTKMDENDIANSSTHFNEDLDSESEHSDES